jgi:hypothetical protein
MMARVRLDGELEGGGGEVLEANGAHQAKLARSVREGRDGDRVAEDVVQPADAGVGPDLEPRLKQPEVVAVPRPEHEPVVAERDRLDVAVGGRVANGDDGHGKRVRPMHTACQPGAFRRRRAAPGRV